MFQDFLAFGNFLRSRFSPLALSFTPSLPPLPPDTISIVALQYAKFLSELFRANFYKIFVPYRSILIAEISNIRLTQFVKVF